MNARQKWADDVIALRDDGRDWVRRILERENAGERFTVTVIDMAKRALGMEIGVVA